MPKILGIDPIPDVTPDTLAGILPLGAVIPVMSHLTGSYSLPASGVVANGFMRCDGSAIPGSHPVSGTTPDLTAGRFVYGTSGAGVGMNVAAGATGGNSGGARTLSPSELPSHNHPLTIATDNAPHSHPASSGNQSANHSHPISVNANNAPHSHPADVTNERTNPGPSPGTNIRMWDTGGVIAESTEGANAPHGHPASAGSNDTSHSHPITVNAQNAPHSHAGSSIGPEGSGGSFSILPEYVASVYLIRVA